MPLHVISRSDQASKVATAACAASIAVKGDGEMLYQWKEGGKERIDVLSGSEREVLEQ
jgi:hypothetical protein